MDAVGPLIELEQNVNYDISENEDRVTFAFNRTRVECK